MTSTEPAPGVQPSRPATWAALALIVGASLFLNLRHNDFPVGYHVDERQKALQVERATFNFRHPLLMLQTVRLVEPLARPATTEEVVRLGRTVVAVTGAAAVAVAFFLFRMVAGSAVALLAAALFALSPSLTVHAHYLKEDVHLTFGVVLSLLALLAWQRRPSRRRLVLLGLATGLACSAKTLGAVLLPFYALVPLVARPASLRAWYRGLAAVTALAGAVFLAVNLPMLWQSGRFVSGFTAELRHAARGHIVEIGPFDRWLGYHLQSSIFPGLGTVVATLGLAALAGLTVARIRGRRPFSAGDRVLLLFAAVFYLAIELSPLKPYPDAMRYALPLLPVVAYLAARGVAAAAELAGRRRGAALAVLAAAVLAFPGHESWRLIEHLESDTRTEAARILAREPEARVLRERHTGLGFDLKVLGRRRLAGLLDSDYDYALVSSFTYDRFFIGETLPGRRLGVQRIAGNYRDLFGCPFREIAPAYRSYALSNPTIRIVDLARCRELRGRPATGPSSGPP